MTEYFLDQVADLDAIMPDFYRTLNGRLKIALYGDMGAGKTTFVAAFCRFLGVREDASSPTFSLVNEYSYTDADGAFSLMHHIDLYRLKSLQEALDIGIEDYLYDSWLCLVEWPQLIEPLLPPDTVKVQLELAGESQRRVVIL